MTRIGILIPTLDRLGGAERQVILLASGLAARGYAVTVIALSGDGEEATRELSASGAEFLSLHMKHGVLDPGGWLRLNKWLRDNRAAILHAHLPHATWMARWSRLFSPDHARIDTVHTTAIGPISRRIGYRLSRRLPDRVTAVSRDAASAYVQAGMIHPSQLVLLPNGVDTDLWRPNPSGRADIRRRFRLQDDEFVWFAAGRLDPVKDYPALLWAMIDLPRPARLIIAGSGPVEPELRRLCFEFGLESRVQLLGFESDVLSWMQAANGFVLSSRWEGLPMSLLEAGACGLPAVATDVPGTREVLVNGSNGFLAAPGSSPALRAAMARLMRLPPEERIAMGYQGRLRVVQNYGLQSLLDRWVRLYNEVLAERHMPLLTTEIPTSQYDL